MKGPFMHKRILASMFAVLLVAAAGSLAAQVEPKGSLQGMTARSRTRPSS